MHFLDPEIAEKVGANAAIIYQNILYWSEHNMMNGKNGHGGMWWTYNSRKAFAAQFTYLTEKQVRLSLEKLVKAGLIVKGEFNKAGYDKTSWYSPACSKGWVSPLAQKGQGLDQKGQRKAQKGQPIPDSKPDNKPDIPPYPPNGGRADGSFEEGFQGRMTNSKPRRRRRQTEDDKLRERITKAAQMRRKPDIGF